MSNIYEYSNSYNNSMSSYSNLEEYNQGAAFGPSLPATVPSNMFPTILKQKPIAPYDVLTHNTEQEYAPLPNAYGKSCNQDYYVGKCPSNEMVRDFNQNPARQITPVPHQSHGVVNQPIVEGFDDLRSLNVAVFVSNKCRHSQDLLNELKARNLDKVIRVHNVDNEQVKQQFTNLGGYATPYIYSFKTNKSVTGSVPINKLVHMLSSHTVEGFEHNKKKMLRDLHLKLYVMRGCGFCEKMKDLLRSEGVIDDVEIVTDLAAHRNELQHVRGFPHMKSKKTGKEMTGYSGSIDTIIEKLK